MHALTVDRATPTVGDRERGAPAPAGTRIPGTHRACAGGTASAGPTHTAVPVGSAPPAPPPRPWPPVAPAAPSRRPPWWVWTLAALGVLVPLGAFAAIIVAAGNSTTDISYTPPPITTPSPLTPPTTGYQPPHSLRAGPAAPGEALRLSTRNGEIRVSVLEVVDPVGRGSYYRGPRAGTRWVGVRLRIANVGGATYNDGPANDTRLVAGDRTLQADSALLTTCAVSRCRSPWPRAARARAA